MYFCHPDWWYPTYLHIFLRMRILLREWQNSCRYLLIFSSFSFSGWESIIEIKRTHLSNPFSEFSLLINFFLLLSFAAKGDQNYLQCFFFFSFYLQLAFDKIDIALIYMLWYGFLVYNHLKYIKVLLIKIKK